MTRTGKIARLPHNRWKTPIAFATAANAICFCHSLVLCKSSLEGLHGRNPHPNPLPYTARESGFSSPPSFGGEDQGEGGDLSNEA